MAPFRISRDRNPLDDTSLCIVVLVLLVLVARREVPFGRLRTHLRPLEKRHAPDEEEEKKKKKKRLTSFACQNVRTFTSVTPMTTANTTPRKARGNETTERAAATAWWPPFFPSCLCVREREREREREYTFRAYFFVSKHIIGHNRKNTRILERTSLSLLLSYTQKQRANTTTTHHHHHHHHPGGRRRAKKPRPRPIATRRRRRRRRRRRVFSSRPSLITHYA